MLASIRKKLLDNSTSTDLPSESAPLTHIPWSLVVNSSSTDSATTTSAAPGKDEEGETSVNGSSKHAHSHFPTASYLDLRRQQNEAWAEERLVEGIALAKTPATRKQAEEAYQQGLEIAPNHSNLLTAYGALCANQGDKGKAIELLNKALQVDPDHEQAKLYRDTILNREREKASQEGKICAASKPTQNEEEEQQGDTGKGNENQFASSTIHIKASKEDPGTKGYSLVEEPSNEDELQSQSSHRQRKRKRKKKKRKKKHHDSGSDADSSSTDSRERRRRRKRKQKKRRKRKEKRRRERDLSTSSSEGEEGSKTSSLPAHDHQDEGDNKLNNSEGNNGSRQQQTEGEKITKDDIGSENHRGSNGSEKQDNPSVNGDDEKQGGVSPDDESSSHSRKRRKRKEGRKDGKKRRRR